MLDSVNDSEEDLPQSQVSTDPSSEQGNGDVQTQDTVCDETEEIDEEKMQQMLARYYEGNAASTPTDNSALDSTPTASGSVTLAANAPAAPGSANNTTVDGEVPDSPASYHTESITVTPANSVNNVPFTPAENGDIINALFSAFVTAFDGLHTVFLGDNARGVRASSVSVEMGKNGTKAAKRHLQIVVQWVDTFGQLLADAVGEHIKFYKARYLVLAMP